MQASSKLTSRLLTQQSLTTQVQRVKPILRSQLGQATFAQRLLVQNSAYSRGFFQVNSRTAAVNQLNLMTNAQVRSFASADLPHHTKLEMPNLSPTMEKGNIAKWLKKEGDQIKPGDILASIETDKASVDFEMQEEGYIAKLLYPEGSKDVKLGQVIAIVVDSQADVAKFADFKLDSAPKAEAPKAASPVEEKRACPMTRERPQSEPDQAFAGGSRVKASPLAQNVARDTGVSL